jgi:hypothetical protein
VIVLDNKIANKKYDYFTFANIRGRSGRMLKHFVGRVIVFNPEPTLAEMKVDIPVLSQPVTISDEILLQLPDRELTEESRERLRPYLEQNIVSIDTLRHNKGLSPGLQLEAAQKIVNESQTFRRALAWKGSYPTAEQIKSLSDLLFTLTGSGGAVRSAKQLGARINILRFHRGDLRAMISDQISQGKKPDDAVEDALDFARNWAQFRIPRALTAIGSLASDVFHNRDFAPADTRVFAGQVENMFLPPYAAVLEEYGLPISLTLKLQVALELDRSSSLDQVLSRLRDLGPPASLGTFEREMFADTQNGLSRQ